MKPEDADFDWTRYCESGLKMLILNADFDWTCDSEQGLKMLILIGLVILNED